MSKRVGDQLESESKRQRPKSVPESKNPKKIISKSVPESPLLKLLSKSPLPPIRINRSASNKCKKVSSVPVLSPLLLKLNETSPPDEIEEKIVKKSIKVEPPDEIEEKVIRKIPIKVEPIDEIEEKIRKIPPKVEPVDEIEEKIRKIPPKVEPTDKIEEKIRKIPPKIEPSAEKVEIVKNNSNKGFPKVNSSLPVREDDLFVSKYIPKTRSDIFDNEPALSAMNKWLNDFQAKTEGTKSAIILHGPPGIGKTSAAHVILETRGYRIQEYNSSEERGKALVEEFIKPSLFSSSFGKPLAIIIDEIDGMDGQSGLTSLCSLLKLLSQVVIMDGKKKIIKSRPRSSVPIICICNDLYSKKLFNLRSLCQEIQFKAPKLASQYNFIFKIFNAEGFKLQGASQKIIKENCPTNDFRQLLIFISQLVSHFNKKNLKIINRKDVEDLIVSSVDLKLISIFDVTKGILSGVFSKSTNVNSSTKKLTPMENISRLMSIDTFLIKNMLQHNYPNFIPEADKNARPENIIKTLDLMSEIADSFSMTDGIIGDHFGKNDDLLLGFTISSLMSADLPQTKRRSGFPSKPDYKFMYAPKNQILDRKIAPKLKKSVDDFSSIRYLLEDEEKFKNDDCKKRFFEFCKFYNLDFQALQNIDNLTYFQSQKKNLSQKNMFEQKKLQLGSGKNSLKNITPVFLDPTNLFSKKK